MNVDEARTALAYTAWANRRVLDACRALSDEELKRDLRTSFRSVHGTLFHILGGERLYLRFWLGQPRDLSITDNDYPDVARLGAFHDEIGGLHSAFLDGLTDAKLAAKWIHPRRGTEHALAEMLQHVVNHGSYHRGQVATMLRQLGREAPATDFILFLAERQEGAQLP